MRTKKQSETPVQRFQIFFRGNHLGWIHRASQREAMRDVRDIFPLDDLTLVPVREDGA